MLAASNNFSNISNIQYCKEWERLYDFLFKLIKYFDGATYPVRTRRCFEVRTTSF